MATKKKAAKKAVAKKAVPKASYANAGMAELISKIQFEMQDGKKRKLNKTELSRAQECMSKSGKLLLSFKKIKINGTGSGGGTEYID